MKQRLALTIAITLSMALSVYAQGIPTTIGGLSLSASNNNPQPGEQVTITAQSFSADISSSRVVWTVNGKVVENDIGANILNVTAPPLGKNLDISISMTTPSGSAVQDSMTLGSGSIDLILESSGYTPPFFAGKILPVYQNAVKVVAMPHLANSSGIEYDPKTLVYDWKRDGEALQDQSGYGKQSVIVGGDLIPRPHDIDVTVSTRDGTAAAEGIVTIDPSAPSVSFYVDDPLYGPLFNRAIGNNLRIGTQKEISVLAVPFGFDTASSDVEGLTLNWSINGSLQQDLSGKDSVVLRAPDGVAGASSIELDATGQGQFLQSASAGFSAIFNGGPSATTTSTVSF